VANPKPSSSDGKSILIVDDDSYFRQWIVRSVSSCWKLVLPKNE
jgi:ActR/RegA family two-component response regulator